MVFKEVWWSSRRSCGGLVLMRCGGLGVSVTASRLPVPGSNPGTEPSHSVV